MDIEKSNLNNLCTRLLINVFKQKLEESHYLAINCDSSTSCYYQKRFDYANEVKRVLTDLKRLQSLLKYQYKESFLQEEGLNQEDIIIFYQGCFLDLVHQLKDKLIKMCYFLQNDVGCSKNFTIENLKKFENLVSDMTIRKFLAFVKEPELKDLMSKWDEDDSSCGIKICLKKRTQYHHRLSGLHQNENFNQIKGFRTVLNIPDVLTSEGEKYLKEKIENTLEDFSQMSQTQLESTFEEVYQNIDDIALLFTNKLGYLPICDNDKGIVNKYLKFSDSLEIVNLTDLGLVDSFHKRWIGDMLQLCKLHYGEKLHSIYLVGSLGRGEYEVGVSDINVYIIFEKGVQPIDQESTKLLKGVRNDIKVVNHTEFLGENYKRDRFICTFDGILLYGEGIPKEEFPQSGSELTYLLNKDLIEEMKGIRVWCEDDTISKTWEELTEKSQYLSNKIVHFLYGVVDANHPGNYTFSRKFRINAINKYYPKNKKALSNLEMARVGNIDNVNSLLAILDVFEPIVIRDIKKIEEVLDKKSGVG